MKPEQKTKNAEEIYKDIINLPHHISEKHMPMSRLGRAAQFSPFAALSGYEDLINESRRINEQQHILSEDELMVLNDRLSYLQSIIQQGPEISVEYYLPDEKRKGGKYLTVTGVLTKIDSLTKTLIINKEITIGMEFIANITYPDAATE